MNEQFKYMTDSASMFTKMASEMVHSIDERFSGKKLRINTEHELYDPSVMSTLVGDENKHVECFYKKTLMKGRHSTELECILIVQTTDTSTGKIIRGEPWYIPIEILIFEEE